MTNKSITIDGIEYVPKGSENSVSAKNVKGMKYVILRTYSAGVHAGYLKEKTGQNAVLVNARRLWYWDGSSSLSELAVKGVSKPENCKFPCEVPEVELDQVIEVLPVTEEAKKTIDSVKIWTSHE